MQNLTKKNAHEPPWQVFYVNTMPYVPGAEELRRRERLTIKDCGRS